MAYDDEDWIKFRTWDVRTPQNEPISTLDDLCYGSPSVQKIQSWQDLTCWNAAPQSLKDEADKWLKEHLTNAD